MLGIESENVSVRKSTPGVHVCGVRTCVYQCICACARERGRKKGVKKGEKKVLFCCKKKKMTAIEGHTMPFYRSDEREKEQWEEGSEEKETEEGAAIEVLDRSHKAAAEVFIALSLFLV